MGARIFNTHFPAGMFVALALLEIMVNHRCPSLLTAALFG